MKCLILCGGWGTRARHYSNSLPKSCLPIKKNKSFVYFQIKNFQKIGIRRFYFLTGFKSYKIKEQIKKILPKNNYEIIEDGIKPKGTANALIKCINKFNIKNRVFITYGDSYLLLTKKQILDVYLSNKNMIYVYENRNKLDKSNIKIHNKLIINYEKNKKFKFIDYGLMCFNISEIKEILDKKNKYRNLDYLFNRLIEKKILYYYKVFKRFFEIGSFKGYIETKNYLKKIN